MSRRRANGTGRVRKIKHGKLYELSLPNNGPTRRFHGSEAQAHAALDDWLRERTGLGNYDRMPTVAEWTQQYLTTNPGDQSVRTLNDTKGRVTANIINDPIGSIPLDQVRQEHIEHWLQQFAGKAQRTVKNYRGDLSRVMEFAVERRRITFNPVTKTTKLNPEQFGPRREKASLSRDEVVRFVEHCEQRDDHWGNRFIVSVMLGLRASEACALRWSGVDLDAGHATISQAVLRPTGAPMVLGPTKNKKIRDVDLDDRTIHALKRQRALNEQYDVRPADDRWPADMIFLPDSGTPYKSLTHVRNKLTRVCADAGVKRVTTHGLRYSCVSVLHPAVPIDDIARMIGDSVEVVREHYLIHDNDPNVHTAAAAWNTLFSAQ